MFLKPANKPAPIPIVPNEPNVSTNPSRAFTPVVPISTKPFSNPESRNVLDSDCQAASNCCVFR